MRASLAGACVVAAMLGSTGAGQTQLPEADPGVRPTRLLDRAEVRVSRIELQPGATRSVHRHDDVEYHLWIPIEGSLEITIANDPAIASKPGQAHFMKRGTSHGFKNVGKTPAAVFEIFIKQTTTASNRDQLEELAALWTTLTPPRATP